jgi:hypothetical protein
MKLFNLNINHFRRSFMNPELSSAAKREWRIFPLLHRNRLATAQPLLHHATSNETQIEQWQTEYPDCSWAVATGSESQVFALTFSIDTAVINMRKFGELDPDRSPFGRRELCPHTRSKHERKSALRLC